MSPAGTSLSGALEAALRAFGPLDRADERSRALVVYTDGEDHEGGVEETMRALIRNNVKIYFVGVGTTSGGPIPLRDDRGGSAGYKTDGAGRVVTTRLDEARHEIHHYKDYDYVLINDSVEHTAELFRAVVLTERARPRLLEDRIQPIVDSFRHE